MSAPSQRPGRGRLLASLLLVSSVLVPLGVLAAPARAADTASISGTVTGGGAAPLENIQVTVYAYDQDFDFWDYVSGATTDASGHYAVTDLPAGTYRVGFDDFSDSGYQSEYWNDKPSVETADDVVVGAGQAVTGRNATLARASTISGTVTNGATGLADVDVSVYRASDGNWVGDAFTAADGTYTVGGLSAGTYKIGFEDFSGAHVGEYWNDKPDLATADPVVVAASTDVTGKNAVLAEPGRVTGTVTAPGGAPIADATVTVYQPDGGFFDEVGSDQTAADGTYSIGGLATGAYRLGFEATGYLSEYWNDKPTVETADAVAVVQGSTTSGRNAQLATPGRITGTVTAAAGGAALTGIHVTAYRSTEFGYDSVADATTDARGAYTLSGLDSGTYRLGFADPAGVYRGEYWNDQATLETAIDIAVVASQTVTGRNASLASASHITGTVTSSTGVGVPGVDVTVYRYDDGWYSFRETTTAANGTYDVGGLDPGPYRIGFADGTGTYSEEFFDDVTLLGKAKILHVPASATLPGISAQLTRSGAISGTVTDGTGAAQGVRVTAYELVRGDWESAQTATTDAAGAYTLSRLRATTHRVVFSDPSGRYLSEAWNDKPDLRSGTDIAVPAAGTVAGTNAVLARAGHITGTVSGPSGNLQGVSVTAYRNDGSGWSALTTTNTSATGAFDLSGLTPGSYRLRYAHPAYLTEYYDDKASVDAATDVVVTAGATTSGRNATLAPRGSIAGTVTNSSGTALAGIRIQAYRDAGGFDSFAGSATTNASGSYIVSNLDPGTYWLQFSDPAGGFAPEWFDNQPERDGATAVTVAASQAVTGKNAQLAGGATIGGHVTGTGGAALADASVTAYRKVGTAWRYWSSTDTDATGGYSFNGLQAGTWRVGFDAPDGSAYLGEYWNNRASFDTADDIVLAAGATLSTVDAALEAGATLTGTVTETGGGPLSGVWVSMYQFTNGFWDDVRGVSTDSSGTYRIQGLRAGTYRLQFDPPAGHQLEWWNDKASVEQADDIAIAAGATVTRDAGLAKSGGISGTVSDAGGALPGIEVTAYTSRSGNWVAVAEDDTDNAGAYVLAGLADGAYRVGFRDPDGVYGRELWNDQPTIATASDVTVAGGAMTTGRNAVLGAGGHISGVITAQGGGPVTGADVTLYQLVGSSYVALEDVGSRDTGLYFFEGLAPGTYRVGASASWDGYIDEYWNDKATLATATDIVLGAAGGADSISFSMQQRGTVTGTVTGPSAQALGGITVTAYRNDGGSFPQVASASTGLGGTYSLQLPAGTYRLGFADPAGTYQSEFFDNVATVAAGTDVVVPAGATVGGRNAQLAASVVPPMANTVPPSISGTPRVGSVLTAAPGTWTPSGATFAYQWLADDVAIGGASASTYTPVAGDIGKTIKVRVTASKAGTPSASVTSAGVGPVVDAGTASVVNNTAPGIPGTPVVGRVVTANPGSWTPAGATFAYQWLAGDVPVAGATKSTYTPVAGDVGKVLKVRVTASAAGFAAATATSAASARVAAGTITATRAPAITGTAKVGKTLTVSGGTWSAPGVRLTYQWFVGAKAVKGATKSKLKLSRALKGKKVFVKVTATAAGYQATTVKTKPSRKIV
ncbi:hypothetical protein ASC77_13355 [Nocardioides sp. Root1257]|uniref:carboxypeptidase regulatory-like domain-containing protein n=1 Tax=unclassified Nocardioides TaxID=2615069 RepID=UPI0006FC2B8F|nr:MULTISPECIES: carboxypeptidase regulatory-like domain-containing protein [unclassified Nocardioides]KQW47444.1 hypothetical protein ASC77_13355 [Nocardioides sp. Root1257]KRC45600.1 hypothetical protein ASE24_13360 [Nocardioides sp. Root224]